MMRYSKVVVRPSLAIAMSALLSACATAQQPGGLERAVAEDEDLGNPRSGADEADDAARRAKAQALLDDPDAEHIDFDGEDQNDAPVDMVTIPPDRSPSKSLMQDVVMGPS